MSPRRRRLFGRDPSQEIDEELRHHVEQRIRDYVDRGMDPESARRAALDRLGDLDRVRDECADLLTSTRQRDERRERLSVSWLDVKLGLRMLARYPGLSLVSVVGMAVAIAIGAGSFAFISAMLDPTLPLDEGDRIVTLQNDRADSGGQHRQALHDFLVWREELRSVRELGAFREESRNLVTADGAAAMVGLAEITASGFRVARVSPLLGRAFTDEDERVGAPAIVVIGYDEWRRRFYGDPDILGASIRLGETEHTVVGVMPEGFHFPYNESIWVPLRLNPNDYPHGGGPPINIFGRLADGFTLRQAQAELEAFGQRMATTFPDTHEHLRPRVLPYALPLVDIDGPTSQMLLYAIQLMISLLLVVVAVNVGVLVYARTATRAGEIAVRSALGASRRRVVAQLFVEALVMSAVASVLGLAIAGLSLDHVHAILERASARIPFWFDLGLSARVVMYTAGLAIAGGAIVGVLPALKATGKDVQHGLQQLSSRGSQMRLGRVWTALIVVQVAIAVTVLPAAAFYTIEMTRYGTGDPGYAADTIIKAWLSMDREEVRGDEEYERALQARFTGLAQELLRRLDAEPGVDATLASAYPGTEDGAWVEVEGIHTEGAGVTGYGDRQENPSAIAAESAAGSNRVRVNHVGVGLFDMFNAPILAGRGFVDADSREGATAVIVDRMFVDSVAGGANVIGRRLRYVGPDGSPIGGGGGGSGDPACRAGAQAPCAARTPRANDAGGSPGDWFEIVGVVRDFPAELGPAAFSENTGKIYHASLPAQAPRLIVRVHAGPAADFLAPLRGITAAVDPTLQLHELVTEAESMRMTQQGLRMTALGILLVTGSVLLLSVAGIYAMMSFTVARRRREIGIRSALGADPRRILTGIFTRAGAQLGAGVAVGLALATVVDLASGGWVMGGNALVLVPAVSAFIVTVGLLAALGPARRGLAVQPTEALREE